MRQSPAPTTSPIDLVQRCRDALAAASRPAPPSPAFFEAVRRMREGDGKGAAQALAGLDDRARFVATGLLERLGARLGATPAAVRAVGQALVRDLKSGAVDELHCIGTLWGEGWSSDVLGVAHPERIADARQGGYAAGRLLDAVRAACAAGDLDTARARAGAIDAYHKETRALALCALGAASSGGARDAHLRDAVKAARGGSLIENGGEEASALGRVVEQLVDLVPADHPAVDAAVDALLALGKKRVKNDVRSYGLAQAAIAAARKAEPGWLARATTLIASIHGDELTWTPRLHLALAHHAAGDAKAEAAALAAIPREAFLADGKVRALYPDRAALLASYWTGRRSPFDALKLLHAAGGDIKKKIEPAIEEKREWSGGLEDAYADLLDIDPAIAARVLAEVDEPALAHHSAATSFEMDGRLDQGRDHLRKALDLGLRGANIASHERLLADRALRDRVESVARDEPDLDDRTSALTDLAELWLRDGDLDRAVAAIGQITIAPSADEEKVWTPYYEMGDRAGWAPHVPGPLHPPTAVKPAGAFAAGQAAIKKLPENRRFDAWCAFAAELADPADLALVRAQIAREKGAAAAPFRTRALVEIDLRLGDFDAALASATALRDGYDCEEGLSRGARRIAEQLAACPGALTLARARAVIDLFGATHPSLVGPHLLTALPTLMVALPAADREAVLGAARKRLKKSPLSVKAAEAVAWAWLGDTARASKLLGEVIAAKSDELSGEDLACAIPLAERHHRLPDRSALLGAALARCEGPNYQICMAIEHTARYLWLAGEQSLLPDLLRTDVFSTEVRAEARRSLIVDAPKHAPRPVEAVLAAWLDAPPNVDQAIEQIGSLAAALDREGKTAEAEQVRRTLPAG